MRLFWKCPTASSMLRLYNMHMICIHNIHIKLTIPSKKCIRYLICNYIYIHDFEVSPRYTQKQLYKYSTIWIYMYIRTLSRTSPKTKNHPSWDLRKAHQPLHRSLDLFWSRSLFSEFRNVWFFTLSDHITVVSAVVRQQIFI